MALELEALQQFAANLLAEGHPLLAIKCLEGCLHLSPMPAEEAQVRLRIAHQLLQHTANLQHARQHLQQAVRGNAGSDEKLGMCDQRACWCKNTGFCLWHAYSRATTAAS